MITGAKKLEERADGRKEVADRSCLADVLVVTRDKEWAASIEKMLNENLYGASVALNSEQVVERLKHTWHHLVLIDLDSIDVTPDYLAANIRKIEPDIPIIGLGNQTGGSCPDITYLKKPLTFEQINDIFPQATTAKEIKTGRRALKGLILAVGVGLFLWVLLIWMWR
ncbi:MAG: hypothetical protein P1P89_22155 [Desulfobacterales bacterium]|nr:hypothetical protein [Desulfobacterales bacterium]